MSFRRLPLCLAAASAACFAHAQIVSVNLDTAGNTWTYIVSYSFEPGQTTSLTSFYLPVGAPVSNIRIEGDDHGWTFETDGSTYVRWFNPLGSSTDDIQSGEAMFFLLDSPSTDAKAVTTVVKTWDNALNAEGPDITNGTFSPVPEPISCIALSVGLLAVLAKRRKAA